MELRKKESLSVDEVDSGNKKSCADCKTTKTPLWRGGPAGPKSLCNACGIRYRKKRRALMGVNKDSEKKKKERANTPGGGGDSSPSSFPTTSNTSETVDNDGTDPKESLKIRFMVNDLFRQSLSFSVKKQRCQRRRKLGEEELAAVSLLALSCGSVFA